MAILPPLSLQHSDEHFYQLGLRQFGAFNKIRFDPPPGLEELLRMAADNEPGISENGLQMNEVVAVGIVQAKCPMLKNRNQRISNLLLYQREMLDEYFSLGISETGSIETLPLLLRGYTPNLDRLPHFLLCLGTQVFFQTRYLCFTYQS